MLTILLRVQFLRLIYCMWGSVSCSSGRAVGTGEGSRSCAYRGGDVLAGVVSRSIQHVGGRDVVAKWQRHGVEGAMCSI